VAGRRGNRRATAAVVALAVGTLVLAGAGIAAGAGAAGAAPTIHGIDVSGWQGPVDWGAVRRSGRLFGFAKATEGATFVDDTFAANRAGMSLAGMTLHGFYHFARPDRNSAAAEAANFLRTVGAMGPGEVPVLDLEVGAGPGVGDWAAEWLRLVAQGTGRTPILYSYQSFLYSIPTSRLTAYPLWIASWGNDDGAIPSVAPSTDRWKSWTWWQYTSKSVVPGVNGHVDESLFAGTAQQLAAFGVGPSQPDPIGDLLRGVGDVLGGLLTPKP